MTLLTVPRLATDSLRRTRLSDAEIGAWLSQFSARILRERGDRDCAATTRWRLTPVVPMQLFSQLQHLLSNNFDPGSTLERQVVEIIRAVSKFGGNGDFQNLVSALKNMDFHDIQINLMDCALCVGGQPAVCFLSNSVIRFKDYENKALYRVATYNLDRLCSEGYDMMYGPSTSEFPQKLASATPSLYSNVGLFGVCNESESLAALEAFRHGSADQILDVFRRNSD